MDVWPLLDLVSQWSSPLSHWSTALSSCGVVVFRLPSCCSMHISFPHFYGLIKACFVFYFGCSLNCHSFCWGNLLKTIWCWNCSEAWTKQERLVIMKSHKYLSVKCFILCEVRMSWLHFRKCEGCEFYTFTQSVVLYKIIWVMRYKYGWAPDSL